MATTKAGGAGSTELIARCVHFNGIQHDACKAGVRYDAVRGPEGGFPCLPSPKVPNPSTLPCDKRQWLTKAELDAEEAAMNRAVNKVGVCLEAIKAKHGKQRGVVGVMPCPTGCGGDLHYTIAGLNGHTHGYCSTEECVRWME